MMEWTRGRLTEYFYEKMKIFSFWRMDCYLIRYSAGCGVGYHTDLVPGKKHYRLNIQLKGIDKLCLLDDLRGTFNKPKRFRVFRADRMHAFGPTEEAGLILSFGVAI